MPVPSRVSSSRVGACGVNSEPSTTTSLVVVEVTLVNTSVAVIVILWAPTSAYLCLKCVNSAALPKSWSVVPSPQSTSNRTKLLARSVLTEVARPTVWA